MELAEALFDLRSHWTNNPGLAIEAAAEEVAGFYKVAPSLLVRKFRENWPGFDPSTAKETDALHTLDHLRQERLQGLARSYGVDFDQIADVFAKGRNPERYLVVKGLRGSALNAWVVRWRDAELLRMDMRHFRAD